MKTNIKSQKMIPSVTAKGIMLESIKILASGQKRSDKRFVSKAEIKQLIDASKKGSSPEFKYKAFRNACKVLHIAHDLKLDSHAKRAGLARNTGMQTVADAIARNVKELIPFTYAQSGEKVKTADKKVKVVAVKQAKEKKVTTKVKK